MNPYHRMNSVLLHFKKIDPRAVTPTYGRFGDAGLDFTSIEITNETELYVEHDTGIAVEIPEGYVGLMFPRSSQTNHSQMLGNAVGVVDSNYRGTLKFRFRRIPSVSYKVYSNDYVMKNNSGELVPAEMTKFTNLPNSDLEYKVGDRVGQLIIIPHPQINLLEVPELTPSNRGENGHGSSGR